MPLHFLWSEVERLMELRGIPHLKALSDLSKIHRTNLYKLKMGEIKPSFSALSKLCTALRCLPGDLLKYVDHVGAEDETAG